MYREPSHFPLMFSNKFNKDLKREVVTMCYGGSPRPIMSRPFGMFASFHQKGGREKTHPQTHDVSISANKSQETSKRKLERQRSAQLPGARH